MQPITRQQQKDIDKVASGVLFGSVDSPEEQEDAGRAFESLRDFEPRELTPEEEKRAKEAARINEELPF